MHLAPGPRINEIETSVVEQLDVVAGLDPLGVSPAQKLVLPMAPIPGVNVLNHCCEALA